MSYIHIYMWTKWNDCWTRGEQEKIKHDCVCVAFHTPHNYAHTHTAITWQNNWSKTSFTVSHRAITHTLRIATVPRCCISNELWRISLLCTIFGSKISISNAAVCASIIYVYITYHHCVQCAYVLCQSADGWGMRVDEWVGKLCLYAYVHRMHTANSPSIFSTSDVWLPLLFIFFKKKKKPNKVKCSLQLMSNAANILGAKSLNAAQSKSL